MRSILYKHKVTTHLKALLCRWQGTPTLTPDSCQGGAFPSSLTAVNPQGSSMPLKTLAWGVAAHISAGNLYAKRDKPGCDGHSGEVNATSLLTVFHSHLDS